MISSPERRRLLSCLTVGWLAAIGCSITEMLERNASAIGDASQAMRGTTRSIERTSRSLRALEPSLSRGRAGTGAEPVRQRPLTLVSCEPRIPRAELDFESTSCSAAVSTGFVR